jgi:hypothetical protein
MAGGGGGVASAGGGVASAGGGVACGAAVWGKCKGMASGGDRTATSDEGTVWQVM